MFLSLLSQLGNWLGGPGAGYLQALSTLGNLGMTGYNIYQMENYKPPQPQYPDFSSLMGGQQPPMQPFTFTMPSMGGGFDEGQFQDDKRRNLALQASRARTSLQGRGVYEGGAVTPEAMAALLGVDDPNELYTALRQYGGQYGGGSWWRDDPTRRSAWRAPSEPEAGGGGSWFPKPPQPQHPYQMVENYYPDSEPYAWWTT